MKINKKYFKIILALLIIPTVIFFFRPHQYWNMHDDMQIIRQLELEKCLKDGQIPCRWTPDLGYGYGYPLFNFYPPLPYFVGQIYRILGFSFTQTVKLTAATQFFAAGFAMYLLASTFFGSLGGLLSAAFFVYAPYHSINVYIRGAMNEAWASVFFPLILLFIYKIIANKKGNNVLLLALSIAGLMLSHNPMVITFAPFAAVWAIYWLYKNKLLKTPKPYLELVKSAFLSLGFVAFYTLPVLFETKYVQIESMFINYYSYSSHFVSLKQMFISSFWGDGPSVWGPNDGMPFMVGYLHWIIPLLLFIYLLYKKNFSPKVKIFYFSFLSALFTCFLVHERSTFIWKLIPTIQKIQFPWRFLNHSAFFFSLSVGIIPSIFFIKNRKYQQYFVAILLALLLIFNLKYFKPVTSGPITDEQKLSGLAWQNQITSGIYDYLPKTAPKGALSVARFPVDEIDPPLAKYQITGTKHGTDWFLFNIKSDVSAKITLSQLAFPNFEILVNNQKVPYEIDKEFGRMIIKITPGDNQIYAKLRNTPIRFVANYITLFTLIGLCLKLIFKK